MCHLIILQCVGNKINGGGIIPSDDYFLEDLGPTRNTIALNRGLILNNAQTLPAYIRYGAYVAIPDLRMLYRNINWPLAITLINEEKLKILIVSAYYGLIEYHTPIAYYDLQMDQVKRFWMQGNVLSNALSAYITNQPNIQNTQAFLSNHYADAINVAALGIPNQWIPYDRGGGVAMNCINPFLATL